ncbi:complex I subunit 5 family protein [Haladaptatus sp. ZSTT2]|uniref:complex I subunit 5 family protein n=1 Tax=Haladaptatus sp. ZSTT2 TaxID=3120515 RepID=UPI00300ED5C1
MEPAHLVIAPLLTALVTAILTLATRNYLNVQRAVSALGGLGYLVGVGVLYQAIQADADGVIVYQLSDWGAPFGITLVADALAVFMLGLAALVSLAALAYSVRFISDYGQRVSYHPLYHLMMVGVTGSFLTGDIFNLFVWFEVMLMSSYVLVAFYSGKEHTRAALTYVVLNLLGSAVMLLAIGGLYATTGTLNMADMAQRLADPAAFGIDPAPVLGLSAILFTVFALKAGIAPFQFWVPPAYRAAPAPVAAMLAGVVKKVGVYAIIRLYFTIFAAATLPAGLSLPGLSGTSFLDFFGPVLFIMATASILLGGFGAVGRKTVDGMLAYSSIGQVGFILLPLAVAATVPEVRTLGIAAALIYSLNHGFAKALLFLASGIIERMTGTLEFANLGGLTERAPVLSGGFFLGALALIGIPPLSGFFGKLLVFDTAARAGADAALAVALVGAILTIAYFSRAWNRGFWGEPVEILERPSTTLTVAVVALALGVVVLGIGFDPVMEAANAAANAALDRAGYIDAVAPEVVA